MDQISYGIFSAHSYKVAYPIRVQTSKLSPTPRAGEGTGARGMSSLNTATPFAALAAVPAIC